MKVGSHLASIRLERVWRCHGEGFAVGHWLGGISLEGCTDIHVLASGTFTAVRYEDEILRTIIRPPDMMVQWALDSSLCMTIPGLLWPECVGSFWMKLKWELGGDPRTPYAISLGACPDVVRSNLFFFFTRETCSKRLGIPCKLQLFMCWRRDFFLLQQPFRLWQL